MFTIVSQIVKRGGTLIYSVDVGRGVVAAVATFLGLVVVHSSNPIAVEGKGM